MRAWFWAIVVAAIWLLAVHVQQGTAPISASATPNFSAIRAKATLARVLGPERPHPAGSDENAAVHQRLLKELSVLGVGGTSFTRMSCYTPPRGGTIVCGTVTDIIAEIQPGAGKAVLLMAHLDSVPAGPGAADDGIGVATLLETIRVLKHAPQAMRHPVMALFTDGEEFGLLGANAFVNDPALKAKVGMVINVDARGDEGNSLLFQTAPGDTGLIGLYARTVPHPAAGSLYGEIYKLLPNDTDLTPFLRAGVPGVNFANIAHVAAYHTAIDTLANLDPRALQSQGDNVLAMTRGLADADFSALKSGNAIYLDVLGLWLPHLSAGWALPLGLGTFVICTLLFWRRPTGAALLMPPALLLAGMAAGFVLQKLASLISGQPDPAYAHLFVLRLSLVLAVWAIALWCARRATLEAAWLWLSGLGLAAAILLPGASPYWIFPALIAALALPFAARRPWLAALPALAMLLIWIPLAAELESLLGLAMPVAFLFCLAMALIPILPLLARPGGAVFFAVTSLLLAIAAGFVAPFDAAHPQRLNLIDSERDGQARYIVQGAGPLPPSLRQAGDFSVRPPYTAPGGKAAYPVPAPKISRRGNDVRFDLQDEGAFNLVVPAEADLRSVTIGDLTLPVPAGVVSFSCATSDCGHLSFQLKLGTRTPVTMNLIVRASGLPAKAASLVKARPPSATPSQAGDITLRSVTLKIPGG